MNVEIYICEGELTENSKLYIPDFNHHEHQDMSAPKDGSQITSIKELKQNGSTILKTIDITQNRNINDNESAITRYLLVIGD